MNRKNLFVKHPFLVTLFLVFFLADSLRLSFTQNTAYGAALGSTSNPLPYRGSLLIRNPMSPENNHSFHVCGNSFIRGFNQIEILLEHTITPTGIPTLIRFLNPPDFVSFQHRFHLPDPTSAGFQRFGGNSRISPWSSRCCFDLAQGSRSHASPRFQFDAATHTYVARAVEGTCAFITTGISVGNGGRDGLALSPP